MIKVEAILNNNEVLLSRNNKSDKTRTYPIDKFFKIISRTIGSNNKNLKKISRFVISIGGFFLIVSLAISVRSVFMGTAGQTWIEVLYMLFPLPALILFFYFLMSQVMYRHRAGRLGLEIDFPSHENTKEQLFHPLVQFIDVVEGVERKRRIISSTEVDNPKYEAGAGILQKTKTLHEIDLGFNHFKGSKLIKFQNNQILSFSKIEESKVKELLTIIKDSLIEFVDNYNKPEVGPTAIRSWSMQGKILVLAVLPLFFLMPHSIFISSLSPNSSGFTINIVLFLLHSLASYAISSAIVHFLLNNPIRVDYESFKNFSIATPIGILDFNGDPLNKEITCAVFPREDLSIDFSFSHQRWIEEEDVPKDSEIVDQAWKYTNKDGSRDMRFKGNYQIPVISVARCDYAVKRGKGNPIGYTSSFELSSTDKATLAKKTLDSWKM